MILLMKVRKPTHRRQRFDHEQLNKKELIRTQNVTSTFQATTIGGKYAPLISLRDEDISIDSMINIYNTAMTATAVRYLGRNIAGIAMSNWRCS